MKGCWLGRMKGCWLGRMKEENRKGGQEQPEVKDDERGESKGRTGTARSQGRMKEENPRGGQEQPEVKGG